MAELIVSEYIIEGDPRELGSDDIRIARARQMDGSVKWAVRNRGACLNKSGEWEYEPMPSSRDEAFLARCRFDSVADATAALGVRTCPACDGLKFDVDDHEGNDDGTRPACPECNGTGTVGVPDRVTDAQKGGNDGRK
jgi:hypothetical protein